MIREIEFQVLVDDRENPEKPTLWAEHGLSILVTAPLENTELNILFDVGASGGALLHNASKMDIDLRNVDVIVISHGHYDHTGGLLDALKIINKPTAIIIHPDALALKYAIKPKFRLTGVPHTISEIKKHGGRFLVTHDSVFLTDSVATTGEIKRETDFEKTPEYYMLIRGGKVAQDKLLDDQALVINHEKGLIVITGCAHAGVVNTIRHAQKIFGRRDVYAVIGGFHLIGASDERIEKTVESFIEINPRIVGPCHCTGDKALKIISDNFAGKFTEVRVGTVLNL